MKDQPRVGLVCAGQISRSAVGKLPGLRQRVHWVKSGTISAASRAANALGSGLPVRDWIGLRQASVILVQAPDEAIPELICEMAKSELDWKERSVVLIDSDFDSTALALLERHGACPGSLNWLGSSPDRYLIEGKHEAVVRMKSLLPRRGSEIIEIRRGGKSDYLTGVRHATDGFLPLLAASVDRFVKAGMEKGAAERTAAALVEASVRAYMRAGRRLLKRPRAPLAR